jgi:hypothetical protein
MNEMRAESSADGTTAPKRNEGGWPTRRWVALIAFVFAAHVVLIFVFGTKKSAAPSGPIRQGEVPQFTMADNSSIFLALDDPTLFALPHGNDIAAMDALKLNQPSFRWKEPPGELSSPAVENLAVVFNRFMQTNQFLGYQIDLKPEPELSEPGLPSETIAALRHNSTLRVAGELAQRRLRSEIVLPLLPWNGVAASSRVQALVDAAGDVVSAVLLPPNSAAEAGGRVDMADEKAIQLARALRFSPAPGTTFGELIFNWLTVPSADTNAP